MDEAPPPDPAGSAEATHGSNPGPRPSAAQAPEGGTACDGDDRLQRLLDATGIIPWEADPGTWRFTQVGSRAADILHYPLDAWYGEDFWASHLHPEDHERVIAQRRESYQTGGDWDIEYRLIAADGGSVWLRELGTVEGGNGPPGKLRGVLRDVGERRRLIGELEERLRFELLLSDLSARFINLPPDQVDREIEVTLRALVEFLGVDRSTLFLLSDESGTLEITHSWTAPGFQPVNGLIAKDVIPWCIRKARRGELVVFSNFEDLPEEAARDKETFRRVGPRASAGFPLAAGGGEVFGALSFGKISGEKVWPDSLLQRLRLVAQVFANALVRMRSDRKLQEALAEVKQLQHRLQEENVYLRQEVKMLHHGDVIGQSPAIRRVLSQAEQVAPTESTVLLLGETGTGKELLAAAIHNLSARRDRAMVKVNCAALPAPLVENELFGREKGAYTGALSKQLGRFELAHSSTLFLDEVGDLPPEVQVKLLRVLQEGTLEHLGSPRPIKVNVRVIAATNRDLAGAVREGRFREDLFYRLNVFPITVPPLRERPQDIPLLVWAFVEEFSRTMGKTVRGVAKESMEALQRYPWPGNVRELRNIIERTMITSTGPTLRVLPPAPAESVAPKSMAMEDVEREHILRALGLTGWRVRGKNGAAELLRLKPTTLESRMARLGIQRPGSASGIS